MRYCPLLLFLLVYQKEILYLTDLNNHPAIFMCNAENGLYFPIVCNLPNAFKCFKRDLKEHLSSNIHKKAAEVKVDNLKEAHHIREREIGMCIEGTYRPYFEDCPYNDFQVEVVLSA